MKDFEVRIQNSSFEIRNSKFGIKSGGKPPHSKAGQRPGSVPR
jgi:hypothetical protein